MALYGDPLNCGACGVACTAPDGGAAACVRGQCVAACPPGQLACGDTCVDPAWDVSHCGACGNTCVAPTGGTSACMAGDCVDSCPDGQQACGGGCTTVASDPVNCGACGITCPAPDAGEPACRDGRCTAGCPVGWLSCEGTCVDPATDAEHCGRCGNDCEAPTGGTAQCANGACAEACPQGQSACEGACVDLASDTDHCGRCANTCTAPTGGTVACSGGTCVGACPAGQALCNGACVDLSNDGNNCGRCANTCSAPTGGTVACSGGTCVGACPAGQALCNGACVDLSNDGTNCGRCANTCSAPTGGTVACSNGACVGACPAGQALCNGACVDLSTDATNCGRCANTCEDPAGGTVACAGGGCVSACPSGQTVCNGGCVNLASDTDNCGRCANTCFAPTGGTVSCSGGACAGACPAGKTLCNGACVDLSTDATNCGRCANTCTSPNGGTVACSNGACVGACPAGESLCNGACVDLSNDATNCGRCAHTCTAPTGGTVSCSGGACAGACPAGMTLCNGACVDLSTDGTNCGRCANTCTAPNGGTVSCSNGACVGACPAGESLCNGACVDLSTDGSNCGRCANTCEDPAGGSVACAAGGCVSACPAGLSLCSGGCVDLSNDTTNCGRCANACVAPTGGTVSCSGGACVGACPAGQALCNGACVDLSNDGNNCGRCANTCTAPTGGTVSCSGGACVGACPAGQALCNGACVNLSNDATNCGRCANTCAAPTGGTVSCSGGACVGACPAGQALCNGACVDLSSDANNCGRCAFTCTAPAGGTASCSGGTCAPVCPAGQAACGGACVDLSSDATHCGQCANTCTAPTGGTVSCTAGACAPACPGGDTPCAGACTDTSSDEQNCGACGVTCAAAEGCSNGTCIRDAPVLTAVEPAVIHGNFDSGVWITGLRLGAPVNVTLVSASGTRLPLTSLLTRPDRIHATVPAGTAVGSWSVEVATPSGTDTLPSALAVTADPFRIQGLSVGQGDAFILRIPGGRTVLIDGSIANTGTRLRAALPSPPDYMVVSHFDADHLSGVYEYLAGPDLLPNTSDDVDPGVLLLDHGDNHACNSQLCQKYLTLRARLEGAGKARAAVPGELLHLGGGVRAHTLFVNGRLADGRRAFTSSENENSVGQIYDFGGFSYYSAGDITGGAISGCPVAVSSNFADVETPAARLAGPLDAMKVSHHGSCTGIPMGFSALTLAQVGLLSVGANNSYCHPANRVTWNLSNLGTDVLLTTAGVTNPANTSGCALTVLPSRAAPTVGDLELTVPGDGTFSASATSTTQSWSRSYTVRSPEAARPAPPLAWFLPDGLTLATRGAVPTEGPIQVGMPSAPLGTDAVLVPWALATDALVAGVEAGSTPAGALAATVSALGNGLSVTPLQPLALRGEYALVLPSRTTGRAAAVLTFTAAHKLPDGPTVALTPPASSPSGALLDLPSVTVQFSAPVTGVTAQSLFLEELDTSADAVFGTVLPAGDGRTYTLQIPATSRVGPGGSACEALCPGLTYAVRASGNVKDARGVPVDTALLPTFMAGTCSDVGAPTLAPPEVRSFPTAVSISVRADEPVTGEIRLAPVADFATACGNTPTAACLRSSYATGSCAGTACVPSSGSCAGYGVFTGLTPGVSYQYEIRAVDQVGLSPAAATTGTVTPASGAALVLSEALYDGPTATESQSEYLEVFNAGDASANVCAYSLAKNGGAATAVCTGTITVPPGGYAVLAGTSFCDAAVSSCATGAWSLPAGTLLARGSNAAPAAGLTNSPAPTLELKSGSTTVSSMGGTGSCPEGESRTRLNLYAPDVPGAFACKPGTPGAATP